MDAAEFVEWVWSITDEDKGTIAGRVALVRAGTDERFLREARSAAEAALDDTGFDAHKANMAVAPDDALDESGRDLETWNRDVGNKAPGGLRGRDARPGRGHGDR